MNNNKYNNRSTGSEDSDQGKHIVFFTSFEEENNATAEMMAKRSPMENFRIAHEMMKAMYKDELAAMPDRPYTRITFTVIDGRPV